MKISQLPAAIRIKARENQANCKLRSYNKSTDDLATSFDWSNTVEGHYFWDDWYSKDCLEGLVKTTVQEPKHYDNTNGSLYKFCEDHDLNTYEFDIIKRVMRCRKKGTFLEDLEKTKFLIDLYIKEQSTNQTK
jgi:hypothetical protein